MQPDGTNYSPTPQAPQPSVSDQPQPDYSFLDQQPRRSVRLPFSGSSFKARLIIAGVGAILFVILLVIVKGLLTTAPFSKSDYQVVVERQQEMIHILGTDVTSATSAQLSAANQNFTSTAKLSLESAQFKTVTLMSDFKDKVSTKKLAAFFVSSVDKQFTNSLSSNTFSSEFTSEMSSQLSAYEQELTTAYSTTRVRDAKLLLRSEYSEAKLLVTALNSPTS